jgi:DNA-binding CsgD family transcriptional regulator
MRWWRAGQPGDGPPPTRRPPPTPQAHAAAQAARDAAQAAKHQRLQEYGRLVAAGLPPKAAARRMGISLSTAYYYNRQLRGTARRGDLRGDRR